jgi:hypothetical protein
MKATIIVPLWICPECPSFYAASSAGDLATQSTHSITGEPTGFRADCSYCKAQGKQSTRECIGVLVPVPVGRAASIERTAA